MNEFFMSSSKDCSKLNNLYSIGSTLTNIVCLDNKAMTLLVLLPFPTHIFCNFLSGNYVQLYMLDVIDAIIVTLQGNTSAASEKNTCF